MERTRLAEQFLEVDLAFHLTRGRAGHNDFLLPIPRRRRRVHTGAHAIVCICRSTGWNVPEVVVLEQTPQCARRRADQLPNEDSFGPVHFEPDRGSDGNRP
jgi:hypothetical protein